jgi:hypothetical protein
VAALLARGHQRRLPGALLQAGFVLTTTVQQARQRLTPSTETNSGVLAGSSINL